MDSLGPTPTTKGVGVLQVQNLRIEVEAVNAEPDAMEAEIARRIVDDYQCVLQEDLDRRGRYWLRWGSMKIKSAIFFMLSEWANAHRRPRSVGSCIEGVSTAPHTSSDMHGTR